MRRALLKTCLSDQGAKCSAIRLEHEPIRRSISAHQISTILIEPSANHSRRARNAITVLGFFFVCSALMSSLTLQVESGAAIVHGMAKPVRRSRVGYGF